MLGDTVHCDTNLPTFVSLKWTQQVFFSFNVGKYILGLGCHISEDNNLHLKLFYLLPFFLFWLLLSTPFFIMHVKLCIWRQYDALRHLSDSDIQQVSVIS